MTKTSNESKTCFCGREFYKRPRDSVVQWASREFCSVTCNNRSRNIKSPLHIRFWEKVGRGAPSDCWEWLGSKDDRGYGKLAVGAGLSPIRASRLAWELVNGPIPDGMNACHTCDNPSCVNPKHIFIGTQKDNMRDCSNKGRLNPLSTKNLRPGAKNHYGAGPISNREAKHVARNQ